MDWAFIRDSSITPAIAATGQAVSLLTVAPGVVFDPVLGKDVDAEGIPVTREDKYTVATPCFGIKQDIKEGVFPSNLVLQATEMILLSATGVTRRPHPGDVGLIGSESFTVIAVKPKSPGGVDLNYLLLVSI